MRYCDSSAVVLLLVRDATERVLSVHPLRAADTLQLGAALLACEHHPGRRPFVVLDDGLALAAEREGIVSSARATELLGEAPPQTVQVWNAGGAAPPVDS
jgi:hypothetical protein